MTFSLPSPSCLRKLPSNETVTVSFNGWNAEWDSKFCDTSEIREVTAVDDRGAKRKRSNITSKVRLST